MPRRRRSPIYANPFFGWAKLAWDTTEMLTASAQVIHHRTRRMTAAGATPNARDRREFILMGQEKLEAAAESLQAMMLQMGVANQQLAAAMIRQWFDGMGRLMRLQGPMAMLPTAAAAYTALASQFSGSMARAARQTLHPIRTRASRNARRLQKKRLSHG